MEENKKLEDFIKKTVKEVGLEKPSANFTDLVLSKIQVEPESSQALEYRPIFSKRIWALILIFVATIFAYVLFGNPNLENTWLSFSQLNRIPSFNILGKIPRFEISNTLAYGISIFTLFVLVQIFFIKYRFDKQYDLT